jgi:hypothetical protein
MLALAEVQTEIGACTTWTQLRTATWHLCDCTRQALNCIAYAAGGTPLDSPIYACMWFANLNPPGGAVTMSAINSAMLTASFAELQNFIGIEDAYRVALWNAPFNAEFYAALARGFQKWP